MNLREMASAAESAVETISKPPPATLPVSRSGKELGRNNRLTSFAGSLVRTGMSDHEIEVRVRVENQKFPQPLPEREIDSMLRQMPRWRGRQQSLQTGSSEPVNSDNSVSSPNELVEISPFPAESLPMVVRQYCEEAADAIGVPIEMVLCPLLAYAGAVIGNRELIQLKPGFAQYPQLWIVTVAPPGAAKSPADDAARMPINELQAQAMRRYDLAQEQFQNDLREWNDSTGEARGNQPNRPELEHFYSTDTTIEALSQILESSPGVALSRDEIVGWVNSFDSYKTKGAERQQHLSAWSGTPIKIDRKTSNTIFIEHPVVSICGGVQPDVMGELSVEAGRRDGFLERILWSVPRTKPAPWSEAKISLEASDALLSLFCRLRHTEPSSSPVRLSQGARQLFTSWYDENQITTDETSGLMAGVYAKMPLQLARIALIAHCMELPDAPSSLLVSAETMGSAIKLVEYFRGQASLALSTIGANAPYQGSGTTARVFQILTNADGEWCSRSVIQKRLGGHVLAHKLTESLTELEESDLAEQRRPESKSTGGRRGEQWRKIFHEITELNEETRWEGLR